MAIPSRIWWTIAAVSCGAMLASGYQMAQRIAAFHRDNPREIFAFQRVAYPTFEFAGRQVEFTDEDQNGEPYVRVRYGDVVERLHVSIKGQIKTHDLTEHDDWMRVVLFSSAMGQSIDKVHEDIRQKRVQPRLAIVTRTPSPGEPLAYAGRINTKAWVFDFYEFKTDGTIVHERLKFPTTKEHEAPKDGELRENTWEYQAALSVIPEGISPKPKFTNDGLKAAGWTLPATTCSTLVMLGAIGAGVTRRTAPQARA